MMCRPKPHPWTAALFLAIASLCSVHSLIVAVALGFGLWIAPWLATRISHIKYLSCWRSIHSRQDHPLRGLFPLCLFGIGTALAVVVILPASDTFYGPAHNWLLDWEPSRASAVGIAFLTAHFPLPRPVNEFWIPLWDTPLEPYTIGLMTCGAILLWVASVFLFSGSPRALATYIIGSLGLSIFLYTKYLGFSRHTGFFFIIFALACWLSKNDAFVPKNTKSALIRSSLIYLSLFAMLASQAINGIWVILQDARRPFSGGKQASQIIQDNDLQFVFISVYPDWAGAPISGYLRRPLFYPSATLTNSYAKWDIHRQDDLSTQEIIDITLANAPGQIPVVLVTSDLLEDEILQKYDFEFLASCLGSLTPGENYFLYVQWNGLVRNKNILR
jgi:hypothetical protein